jgi:hypothetical protein
MPKPLQLVKTNFETILESRSRSPDNKCDRVNRARRVESNAPAVLSFALARPRFLSSANYLRHEEIEVDLGVCDRLRNSMPQPRLVITFH